MTATSSVEQANHLVPVVVSFVIISKDEPQLERTLSGVMAGIEQLDQRAEVIVVDASEGRLDWIRDEFPDCRWIRYDRPPKVRITIPHQRNRGVQASGGQILVFTDSGCLPDDGWAAALIRPILEDGENVSVGATAPLGEVDFYTTEIAAGTKYVDEAPTINMAFTRYAFDVVGGFDESFEYGSDVDFNWRLAEAGYRMRLVPSAVVRADWGSPRRQLRRAWFYGQARARLYEKHPHRVRTALSRDPVPFAYSLFLVLLPFGRRYPWLPAVLIAPALRNRRTGMLITLADHLILGAGFLRGIIASGVGAAATAATRERV